MARNLFLASALGRRIPVSPLTLAVPPPARKPTPAARHAAILRSFGLVCRIKDGDVSLPIVKDGGLLRTQQEQDMTKLNAKTKKAAKAAKRAPAKKAKAR